MRQTVKSWTEFKERWDGALNFLLEGECVPFAFDLPPLEVVVEQIRRDEDARILSGSKGASLNLTSIAESFRALPIEEAMKSSFQLSHFQLNNFYGAGQLLHGFEEQVMQPWQNALKAAGFIWDRCYPIIFISGPHCATNYHMDISHVVAWQRYGTKNFCGLKDPMRWTTREERTLSQKSVPVKPDGIRDEDTLCYEMRPGSVLWNCLLTPHWVEASDEAALSINISHGGLRLNGQLSPLEHEREQTLAAAG
jgi:hypothetical protein